MERRIDRYNPELCGQLINGVVVIGKPIRTAPLTRVEVCRHPRTNCRYVIKTLTPINPHDTRGMRGLFLREVATAQVAGFHPNLVPLADAIMGLSELCLLYPYAEKRDLFDCIRNRPWRTDRWSAKVLADVVHGLQHLHAAGIIHRDIKTENVLITKSGRAMLCDFAFCEWETEDEGHADNGDALAEQNSRKLTVNPTRALRKVTQQCIGTKGCISPEVLNGEFARFSSDVYSLGVLFFEVICGKHAFPVSSDSEESGTEESEDETLPTFPHTLSPDARELIVWMLDTNPRRRPTLSQVMNHRWMIRNLKPPPAI